MIYDVLTFIEYKDVDRLDVFNSNSKQRLYFYEKCFVSFYDIGWERYDYYNINISSVYLGRYNINKFFFAPDEIDFLIYKYLDEYTIIAEIFDNRMFFMKTNNYNILNIFYRNFFPFVEIIFKNNKKVKFYLENELNYYNIFMSNYDRELCRKYFPDIFRKTDYYIDLFYNYFYDYDNLYFELKKVEEYV